MIFRDLDAVRRTHQWEDSFIRLVFDEPVADSTDRLKKNLVLKRMFPDAVSLLDTLHPRR